MHCSGFGGGGGGHLRRLNCAQVEPRICRRPIAGVAYILVVFVSGRSSVASSQCADFRTRIGTEQIGREKKQSALAAGRHRCLAPFDQHNVALESHAGSAIRRVVWPERVTNYSAFAKCSPEGRAMSFDALEC